MGSKFEVLIHISPMAQEGEQLKQQQKTFLS